MNGPRQVSGVVYNEKAFRNQENKRLSTYIRAAGGPTRQADKKRIFQIRADETIVSKQHQNGQWRGSFESLTVLTGDSIVIPTKLKSPMNFVQQLPLVTHTLSQTALTGVALSTSY